MNSEDIKTIIKTATEPVVFNNLLKWQLLDWDISKWKECLGNTKLQFRLGSKKYSKEPQWEKTCEIVKGTFEDFLNFNEENKWLYFDYKYLNQWFIDKFDLRNEISWENYGYSDMKAEDSTIWIGSEGAHTPCHVDTYGFNLVAQLTGRKLWLLFPPNTDLKPTRIPYEESTVYSSINFYCPSETMNDYLSNTNCKKIILEPGQVLFVPNGWWHYVENLELSISINTWIPIDKDHKKRIFEAITLSMVKSLTSCLKNDEQDVLINNAQDLRELSTFDTLNLIESAITSCKSGKPELNTTDTTYPNNKATTIEHSNYVQSLSNLNGEQLHTFLKQQTSRFSDNESTEEKNSIKNKPNVSLVKKYLSVLTDPEVIELIERKLTCTS
ncbi:HSPB1-associated protein 1 isoform X1 [Atheta coriaria]|uniref:HSPB1-associated protein 1 isoform X1 n=1 Tax=Dalotia coriaria TaxID=877792 RepID=UPI0031F3A207